MARRGAPRIDPEDVGETAQKVFKMALLGGRQQDIWEALGISRATYYRWLQDFPEISEAQKRARKPADAEVAVTAYKMATGQFYRTIEKPVVVTDEVLDPETGKVVGRRQRVEVVETVEQLRPTPRLIEVWLRFRAGWQMGDDGPDRTDAQAVQELADKMQALTAEEQATLAQAGKIWDTLAIERKPEESD